MGRQKRRASPGEGGVKEEAYEQDLAAKLAELCAMVARGRSACRLWRTRSSRVRSPQSVAGEVLSAVYEADVVGGSPKPASRGGFGPLRNPHMAQGALHAAIMSQCLELGARCRHPQFLRLGRPRVALADAGAQDRRSPRPLDPWL
jgi:hypothetical protein